MTKTAVQSEAPASIPQSPNRNPQPDRPRIDFAQRDANRQLGTNDLLALLQVTAPTIYDRAEIIGKWVWIQFPEKQPPQITSQLAQLGFHWNNKRQVWQHPCGRMADGSPDDPRQKYGSCFAADQRAA